MKRKDILDALNDIDFDMVEDAEEKHHRTHNTAWIRWSVLAACICLVVAAMITLPIALRHGHDRWLDIPGESTGESTENSEETISSQTTADTEPIESESDVIPHTHASSDWIIDLKATCQNDGSKHKECTVCKEVLRTETINKAHTNTVVLPQKAQTCTDTGLTEGLKCADCGEILREQTVIPTHTRVTIPKVNATCKVDGATAGVKCSECETVLVQPEPVPAAHTSIRTVIDIEDGLFCGDEGHYTETVSCNSCGELISSEVRELPEKHNMANDACVICKLPQSTTQGMLFTLNPDGKSYTANVYGDTAPANIVVGVYNNLSVTELGGVWSSKVKTITIADCVKKIDSFIGCTALISVTIGNGVTEIPLCAFEYCTSLTTVRIGDNVQKIGEYAFRGCSSLYYVYITDAYDWKCGGRYIYGGWIGAARGTYFADYLTQYVSEWHRQ